MIQIHLVMVFCGYLSRYVFQRFCIICSEISAFHKVSPCLTSFSSAVHDSRAVIPQAQFSISFVDHFGQVGSKGGFGRVGKATDDETRGEM